MIPSNHLRHHRGQQEQGLLLLLLLLFSRGRLVDRLFQNDRGHHRAPGPTNVGEMGQFHIGSGSMQEYPSQCHIRHATAGAIIIRSSDTGVCHGEN